MTAAEELRAIADYFKREAKSLFGWGDTYREYNAKVDRLLAIADELEKSTPGSLR